MNESQLSTQIIASALPTRYAGVVAFITVVAEGSFAQAATRLGVGRSAVSRSVQKLEEHLGVRLFARNTRGTSLTHEGRLFHAQCRPGVERIIRAMDEVRELRDGPPQGRLRVAAPTAFGRAVVAPMLDGFRVRYPRVAIELVLGDRPVDLVADGIDVAFRDGLPEDVDTIARRVASVPWVLCASPAYLRSCRLPATPGDLKPEECLGQLAPTGRVVAWTFREAGRISHRVPASALSFNDGELLRRAAIGGQGFAQLPLLQVQDALADGQLRVCLPDYAPPPADHYLCYLSRRQMPSRVRAFIDHVVASIHAEALDQGHTERPGGGAVASDALTAA
ncbi:LysR family transcriptional regulator [Luteibacter sp. PPL201]|uniref:LysR family transcriptional regulator n=1 Tax=Luteibacter sahnii TaxID=3021977 RepID=A0ABT6BCF1_9GAMM